MWVRHDNAGVTTHHALAATSDDVSPSLFGMSSQAPLLFKYSPDFLCFGYHQDSWAQTLNRQHKAHSTRGSGKRERGQRKGNIDHTELRVAVGKAVVQACVPWK